MCGGLQVNAAVFDCKSFCRCDDITKCDRVCKENVAQYVARMREVRGPTFDNIPHTLPVAMPVPPSYIAVVRTGNSRFERRIAEPWIALRLFDFVDRRTRVLTNITHESIIDRYRLNSEVSLVLTGTHFDHYIESWWGLEDRRGAGRKLRDAGIRLVTTPNFSVFSDVPRHDNFFNQKRILIVAEELLSAGVQCAIHLNARTERDYERFAHFLRTHPEYEYVAFEFGTGAGHRNRIDFHVTQLCQLARSVSHPLRLVARGGLLFLSRLDEAFASVHFLDSDPFVKTQKRHLGVVSQDGLKVKWDKYPTMSDEPLDQLFERNVAARTQQVQAFFNAKAMPAANDKRYLPDTPADKGVRMSKPRPAAANDPQSLTLDFPSEIAGSR